MAAVTGTFQHLKNALCQDPINTELVTKIIDSDGYEVMAIAHMTLWVR
jgi:hypothetical protein